MEGVVRAVASEIVPVRINVVCPGLIDTPMFPQQGKERDEHFRAGTANNLIPRAGRVEEVAAGVMFLLENDFVTGTTVDVDGGAILS